MGKREKIEESREGPANGAMEEDEADPRRILRRRWRPAADPARVDGEAAAPDGGGAR